MSTYAATHVGAGPVHNPFAGVDMPAFLLTGERAACADRDPEMWFPPPGDNNGTLHAKKVCRICPLVDGCLQWALSDDDLQGVWGGKTRKERREIRQGRDRIGQCGLASAGTMRGYAQHMRAEEVACWACLEAKRGVA